MGYGIIIDNKDSRVQIDSDSGLPTLYQASGGSVNSGYSGLTNSNWQNLIFAKPNTTTTDTQIYRTFIGADTISTNNATTITYKEFKETTAGLTPSTGYGINIFNSAQQCIFSGTSGNFINNMEILYVGTFGSQGGEYFDIAMPNSTYALSTGNIYILLNPSTNKAGPAGTRCFYEYLFSQGTYGTMRIWSYTTVRDGEPGSFISYNEPATTGNAYVVGYLRG